MRVFLFVLLTFLLITCQNNKTPDRSINNRFKDANWLNDRLHDKNLVLLQIGRNSDFREAHIPGAQWLDSKEIAPFDPADSLHIEVPATRTLLNVFESLGINDSSLILLYTENNWFPAVTTRAYFTLEYLGLGKQTYLLAVDFEKWKADGFPTTNKQTTRHKTKLKSTLCNDCLAANSWVEKQLTGNRVVFVDARNPKYYSGSDNAKGRIKRPGHIPGAVNIPYSLFFDEDESRYIDPDKAKSIFTQAGIKKGDTIIVYCHMGQQATVIYFYAKMLGYDVRLFDGSYEWWERDNRPVEKSKTTD